MPIESDDDDPMIRRALGHEVVGHRERQLPLVPAARVTREVDALIDDLTNARVGACCNFYADDCDDSPFPTMTGRSDGPAVRRSNLRRYLAKHWEAGTVLVGEAPGYRGARLSGIPFTSQHQLEGTGQKEGTATLVHRVLRELGAETQVLLWNVVPLHPHKQFLPRSNRTPTADEVRDGQRFLRILVEDRRAIAVGRIAAAATGAQGVRHPANGGFAEFATDLRRLIS